MEEKNITKSSFTISNWALVINAESHEQFFEVYDIAIKQIPDTALNKKWYRSPMRTLCGRFLGIYKYIIPLNNPTLAKIVNS